MTLLLWLLVAAADPFTVTIESVKATTQGISVTLRYVNNLPERLCCKNRLEGKEEVGGALVMRRTRTAD
jgi:hypothetical protein